MEHELHFHLPSQGRTANEPAGTRALACVSQVLSCASIFAASCRLRHQKSADCLPLVTFKFSARRSRRGFFFFWFFLAKNIKMRDVFSPSCGSWRGARGWYTIRPRVDHDTRTRSIDATLVVYIIAGFSTENP